MTDTEIRAWLAERWSRSQPKEAALDYMADGEWQVRREEVRREASRSAGETPDGTASVRTAANDNALARIARDIRRTAFGWRHARTVAAFADGRREVLAAWDALRERTRVEGDAVALGREFGETLARHAALLKQAGTFRARPDEYAALLAERGGIGRRDLDAFEQLHARARRHRRAATMRQVHRAKREADRTPGQTPGQGLEQRRRQDARAEPQTREERATRRPTGRPRILPASVGRLQRNRGRAQGGAEGLRRVPGTGGRQVRHGRGKGEPDPQEVQEPENGPVAVTDSRRRREYIPARPPPADHYSSAVNT